MCCGSKYVQNKDTKEIMIPQTEFAVKVMKVPVSPARKKVRDDPADKAEVHAFRGVSGSISRLAVQTRPDVSCQVSQLQETLPQPTVAQVVHQAWWCVVFISRPIWVCCCCMSTRR